MTLGVVGQPSAEVREYLAMKWRQQELAAGRPSTTRREPCECGQSIVAGRMDPPSEIEKVMRAHNRTTVHQEWRRREGY